MIKTSLEYKKALEQIKIGKISIEEQEKKMKIEGLNKEQITRLLEPAIYFHEQLKYEVKEYEKIRKSR